MTGGEVAAAGKALEAAGQAGKRALSEDEAVKAKLLELAETSPALQDAADAYARRIQIKQSVLTKMYEPLAKLLGIRKEYFDTQFADDLAARVVNIPDEAVQSPAPSVALPAMQGLGWSLDEPDLKEMYLNLLATATDGRQAGAAHPSFADIIKQLSATEAQSLLICLGAPHGSLPVVQLRLTSSDRPGNYGLVLNNLFESLDGVVRNRFSDVAEGVWVQNWERLGLIAISYAERVADDSQYEWVERRPEFTGLRDRLEGERLEIDAENAAHAHDDAFIQARFARTVTVEQGMIRVTDFGNRFLAAVSPMTDVTVVPSRSSGPPEAEQELRPGA